MARYNRASEMILTFRATPPPVGEVTMGATELNPAQKLLAQRYH